MTRKTQPNPSVTISRAQVHEFVGHLEKLQRNIAGLSKYCEALQSALEENHSRTFEGGRRPSEHKTIRTTPLKSSLAATKSPRGLTNRKDSPLKTLRFKLPVRSTSLRQSEDRTKDSDKNSDDKGSNKKSSHETKK